MRRIALLLPALAGLATPALAGEPWPHFVRTGDDFVCQSAVGKPAADDKPCLAIGPLAVGMRRRALELVLNKPVQEDKVGGHDYFGYVIGGNDPAQMDTASLTFAADGTADSIQLTGEPMQPHWTFCGLELGASEATLRARMGEPLQTGPSNMPNTTTWSYGPSIAFGVRAGKIDFIHISKTTT